MKALLSRKTVTYLLTSIVVLALFLPVVASAGEYSTTNAGQGFNSAWQRYATKDNAAITYGYNTTLINEDYTWANHSTATHQAKVKNANNTYWGSSKSAGTVSKIEVKHSGSTITYACQW